MVLDVDTWHKHKTEAGASQGRQDRDAGQIWARGQVLIQERQSSRRKKRPEAVRMSPQNMNLWLRWESSKA